MTAQNQLLHDHAGKTILRMAGPMALGLFAIFFFNLVDTFFISMLGTDALAALSFTFPITFSITSCTLGLATAMTSNVGYLIGRGELAHARRFVTHNLLLSLMLIATGVFFIRIFLEPIFLAMGAKETLLPLIREYLHILLLGLPFLTFPMLSNAAMRATGDTRLPSLIMVSAGVINGILDPIFIFGWGFVPAMGIKGASLASVIAWCCALIYALYVLYFKKKLLALKLSTWSQMRADWQRLLHVGIPAATTNVLTPLSTAFIIKILSIHGHMSVAGYGAATRIESMLLISIMAFASVLAPFIAQNIGAGSLTRAHKGLQYTTQLSFIVQLGLYIPLWFLAPILAGLFSKEPAIIAFVTEYFRVVALSYSFVALLMLNLAAFNGIRASGVSLMIDLTRLCAVLLPLVYCGSLLFGASGVLYGICLANILTGLLAFSVQRRFFNTFAHKIL